MIWSGNVREGVAGDETAEVFRARSGKIVFSLLYSM